METRSPFHPSAGNGTVRIWQDEPGYRVYRLLALNELPPRSHGTYVLLREEQGRAVVVAMDALTQYNSPAKTIERIARKKEVEADAPTSVAFKALPNWDEAVTENARLHEFYRPSLALVLRA